MTQVDVHGETAEFKVRCALCRANITLNPRAVSCALMKYPAHDEFLSWRDHNVRYSLKVTPCQDKGCNCKDGVLEIRKVEDEAPSIGSSDEAQQEYGPDAQSER